MKFLFVAFVIVVLVGFLYLALKLLGRLMLGEFPKSETKAKSPAAQKAKVSNASGTKDSWLPFVQTLVIAVVIGIFSVSRINGCTEMVREWKASDARTAAYEANPDNYWWELWEQFPDGSWRWRASEIERETSTVDGRVVLTWRSDKLGGKNITARCIPGQEGAWSALDRYGSPIKRVFAISVVTDKEIHGYFDQKDDDVMRRSPFLFKRDSKR